VAPVPSTRVPKLAVVLLVALALAAGGYAASSRSAEGAARPVVVQVAARDFSYALSRRTVPPGRVRIVVINKGSSAHDFAIGGRKTPLLKPNGRATLDMLFSRSGAYRYRCTVPGHAALGMKGILTVTKTRTPPGPVSTPTISTTGVTTTSPAVALKLVKIGDFARPVYVTAPPGDEHRIFVVEQRGTIQEVIDGQAGATEFLDLTDQVQEVSERGLLSMAFAPDYDGSGRFYVDYTDRVGNGNVNVVEFQRSAANPFLADRGSARSILEVVKPYENHNAGMLQFGPDGYLYVSVGDGDSGVLHKPGAFAQTLDDLLGNILRFDPRKPAGGLPYSIPASNPFVSKVGARGEVWDYGLRNPWRFWIDQPTGDLYIGDAGLGGPEEIDYAAGNPGGLNFGWPCFQGMDPFDATETCADPVSPVYQYDHGGGRCTVIGGVVVRDPRLPTLAGRYLFADYCDGKITSTVVENGKATDVRDLGLQVAALSSFGVDGLGRVYVTSTDGGVYRLDPA
jgi:glucose/arabinose dehydrogenase